VQVAAATTRPTVSMIGAALGRDDVNEHLRVASDAGIVDVTGDRVSFTHPVLASVAYLQTSPADRRTVPEQLAKVLDDPEERGRHLALAADGASAALPMRQPTCSCTPAD
jgi:hypothetical protein